MDRTAKGLASWKDGKLTQYPELAEQGIVSLLEDREVDERTALTALSTAIGAPVPAVAAIGAADPQTEAASKLAAWVSFGTVRPTGDDFGMLRLLLLALLPQIGGLLLMVSRSR